MFPGWIKSCIFVATAVAYYVIDVSMMRRFDRRRTDRGTARAWDYTIFAVLAGALVMAQPIWLPFLGLSTSAWWGLAIQAVGIVLTAGGLALTGWARYHLREYFGERVETQDGQVLIESGPYAYIRHPLYTSFFMITTGWLLVNPALTTLAIVIYVLADFGRIAPGEEELLAAEIPGYREYIGRTGRFLPRLGVRR